MCIAFCIIQLDVHNIAIFIIFRLHPRVQKAFIRGYPQLFIAFKNLPMQLRVYVNGIFFNQCPSCIEITFTLDTLYFAQLTGKNSSQAFVILHRHIMLSAMHL